jgi:hypothetical protein
MPRIHWAYHAVAICSALVAGLFFSPGYGQEPEIRHVELDAKAAEAQLRRQPGWVRISRDELERTLAAIRQRQQTVIPQIVHAEYQARWEDRALVGETRWQVWVAEAEKAASPNQVEPSRDDTSARPVWWQWQPFSLALRLPVRVNGQPALAGGTGSGEVGIWLPDKPNATPAGTDSRQDNANPVAAAFAPSNSLGRYYDVAFSWSARLEARGEEEFVVLEFPPAPLANFHVELPAHIRPVLRDKETALWSVTPVANRPQWRRYSWALSPGQTRLALNFRRHVSKPGAALLHVHQQVEHSLTADHWQARYQLALESSQERLDRVMIHLPAGTEVLSVQERLRGLSAESWKQQVTPQACLLEVILPALGERRVELDILCRPVPLRPGQSLAFPLARVNGSASMTSVISIRWSPELTLRAWQFGDFQPQHPPQLVQEKVWQLTLEQATLPLLPIVSLPRAQVARHTADLSVQAEFQCHLGVTESELRAQLIWSVRSGSAFSFPVRLPEGWQVTDVHLLADHEKASQEEANWLVRQQGQRLIAELQKGVLTAPATVRMLLRMRATSAQPDFTRRQEWPLPEIVPEQVGWAQAKWYIWLERIHHDTRTRRLAGVLLPGPAWSMRPEDPGPVQGGKSPPDYVFLGPLPSGSRMRIEPLTADYRTSVETHLEIASDLRPSSDASSRPAQDWPGQLYVRWSVLIKPASGLVRSAQVRFPGEVPDLTWKVVTGENRVHSTQKRLVKEKSSLSAGPDELADNQTQEATWTIYEWTFDRPLLAPIRLEADWLFPCLTEADTVTAESSRQDMGRPPIHRPLWRIPLVCGLAKRWWEGRITVGDSFPANLDLMVLPVATESQLPAGLVEANNEGLQERRLHPPERYYQPALVVVGARPLSPPQPVIQGALLGISWDGSRELICDYYAWLRAAPQVAPAAELQLRLPTNADLRFVRLFRVHNGQAIPAETLSKALAEAQTGMLTLPVLSGGTVLYHLRYTLPATGWLGVRRLSFAAPEWQTPTVCLGERILVRLPASWHPLTQAEKLYYAADRQSALVASIEEAGEEAKLVWRLWLGESPAPTDSLVSRSPGFPVPGSWAIWEIFPSATSTSFWVDTERAQALSAAITAALMVLGTVALRWIPRTTITVSMAVLFVCLLALIWLPGGLTPVILWPCVACAFVGVLWLRRQHVQETATAEAAVTTDWFQGVSSAVLLGMVISCWAGLTLAQENAESTSDIAAALPSENKAKSVVVLLHYRESEGASLREWVLVPEPVWQGWQKTLRASTPQPAWCITASRWKVRIPASPTGHANSLPEGSRASRPEQDSVAQVVWELEVHVLDKEARLKLAVAGVRWQQIEGIHSGQKRTVEVTPLDQPSGLLIRLPEPGEHRLELTGQVEIQRNGQEYRLAWEVPPIPTTQVLAEFPAGVLYADCPTARGWRRLHSDAKPMPPANIPVSLQAELGSASQILLSWQIPDDSKRTWKVDEAHLLRFGTREMRLQTQARYDISQGLVNELRWSVPEFCDVQSVEMRPLGQTTPVSISWRTVSSPTGRILIVQPQRPIGGSWQITIDTAIVPASASVWRKWQTAFLAGYIVTPQFPLRLALAQLEGLETWTHRRLALELSLPRALAPGATRRALLACQADDGLTVEVTATSQATPTNWDTAVAQGWSILLPQPGSDKGASTDSHQRLFRITGINPRFWITVYRKPAEPVVESSVVLELDWFQPTATFRLKLHNSHQNLPVSAVCQLPSGLRIQEVSGDQLSGWQQEGNTLRLWWRQRLPGTSVQIRGIILPSAEAGRRWLALPNLQMIGFQQTVTVFEINAGSGLEFRVNKAQGLKARTQSPSRAVYEAQGAKFAGIVEILPLAGSLQVQMNATLLAEPLWWENLVECRTSSGSMRKIELTIEPWSGSAPLVISEELHRTEVVPLPDGRGYRIHLEFPDTASLFDKTVRFQLAGRPPLTSEGAVILPIVKVSEAANVRHLLTTWPRHAEIAGGTPEKDARLLPIEPREKPPTVRLRARRAKHVDLLHQAADCWYGQAGRVYMRYSCWLVHPLRATLCFRPPTTGQLVQVYVNDLPVPWWQQQDWLCVALHSPSGISQVQMFFVSQNESTWPVLAVDSSSEKDIWVRLIRPAYADAIAAANPAGPSPAPIAGSEPVQIKLAQVEDCLDWLERTLPAAESDLLPTLARVVQVAGQLLTTLEQQPVPEQLSQKVKTMQQRWASVADQLLTALKQQPAPEQLLQEVKAMQQRRARVAESPQLAPSGPSESSRTTFPPQGNARPFVAGEPVWQPWPARQPLVVPASSSGTLPVNPAAWLATAILALVWMALSLIARSHTLSRYARRLAPELLLLAAVYWWAFLKPSWPAAILASCAVIWRLRRWFRPRSVALDDASFVLSQSQPAP